MGKTTNFCGICKNGHDDAGLVKSCEFIINGTCMGDINSLKNFIPFDYCPACGGVLGFCGCYYKQIVKSNGEIVIIPYAENGL